MCSQTKAPWLHVDLSIARPIQGFSYLILVNLYKKWSKVISFKCATIGIIIHNYRQVLATHVILKTSESRNVTQVPLIRFDLSRSYFHSPPKFIGLEEQLIESAKSHLLMAIEDHRRNY
ncbi:unnamed protein product [Hymenolepis diminuta]|uniref:Uncharacterized protein n=1 Tax=Hymenolepis diminuta TaxID=6216 RepID=A0A564YFL9_HYMDI|nr:unnamed protein product [Hymenolepis diminuta]